MLLECLCMHETWLGAPSASFISLLLRVIALALYQGLQAAEARLVQKGGYRTGADNRALGVEHAKMLNIP